MPEEPKVAVFLRMPPDLYAEIKAKAEAEDRTFSAQVFRLLRQALASRPSR